MLDYHRKGLFLNQPGSLVAAGKIQANLTHILRSTKALCKEFELRSMIFRRQGMQTERRMHMLKASQVFRSQNEVTWQISDGHCFYGKPFSRCCNF